MAETGITSSPGSRAFVGDAEAVFLEESGMSVGGGEKEPRHAGSEGDGISLGDEGDHRESDALLGDSKAFSGGDGVAEGALYEGEELEEGSDEEENLSGVSIGRTPAVAVARMFKVPGGIAVVQAKPEGGEEDDGGWDEDDWGDGDWGEEEEEGEWEEDEQEGEEKEEQAP